jgi:FtsP/CotA-like multicopper oxidase with cupredoxin domain
MRTAMNPRARAKINSAGTWCLLAAASLLLSTLPALADPEDGDSFAFQSDSQSARNISGVWLGEAQSIHLRPLDGKPIPMTPRGIRRYAVIKSGLARRAVVDRTRHDCLPAGVPRILATIYPFHIVQTPGQVSMLFEENRSSRIIRLNTPHFDPATWDPSFMGEAIASWKGDVLTIETTNFKAATFLDESGLPHSDRLKIVEQVRKQNGGRKLEIVATISDPEMYQKPWSVKFTYTSRPDVSIMTDWVCGEPHRDIVALRTGAAK